MYGFIFVFPLTGEKLPGSCTGTRSEPIVHEDLDKVQDVKDGMSNSDDTVAHAKINIHGCSIYQACIDGLKGS